MNYLRDRPWESFPLADLIQKYFGPSLYTRRFRNSIQKIKRLLPSQKTIKKGLAVTIPMMHFLLIDAADQQ